MVKKRKNRIRDLKRNEVIQVSNSEICLNTGYLINSCNLAKLEITGTGDVWDEAEILKKFSVSSGTVIFVKIIHDEESMIPSGKYANVFLAEVKVGPLLPVETETEKYIQLAKIESVTNGVFKITERHNDNIFFALRNFETGSSS